MKYSGLLKLQIPVPFFDIWDPKSQELQISNLYFKNWLDDFNGLTSL